MPGYVVNASVPLVSNGTPLIFDIFEESEESMLEDLPVPLTCCSYTVQGCSPVDGLKEWDTIHYGNETRHCTAAVRSQSTPSQSGLMPHLGTQCGQLPTPLVTQCGLLSHSSTQTFVTGANSLQWCPMLLPVSPSQHIANNTALGVLFDRDLFGLPHMSDGEALPSLNPASADAKALQPAEDVVTALRLQVASDAIAEGLAGTQHGADFNSFGLADSSVDEPVLFDATADARSTRSGSSSLSQCGQSSGPLTQSAEADAAAGSPRSGDGSQSHSDGPCCSLEGPRSNNSHFDGKSGDFDSQSLANTMLGESSVLFDSIATKDFYSISLQTRDLPQKSQNFHTESTSLHVQTRDLPQMSQYFIRDSPGDHTMPADAMQRPDAAADKVAIKSGDFDSQSLANTIRGESSVLFDSNATKDFDSTSLQTRDLPQKSQNFFTESTSLLTLTRDLPQKSQYLLRDSPGDHTMPAVTMQQPHTAADKSGDFNSQSLANTVHGDSSVLFDSNATKDFVSICTSSTPTRDQPQKSQNVVTESIAQRGETCVTTIGHFCGYTHPCTHRGAKPALRQLATFADTPTSAVALPDPRSDYFNSQGLANTTFGGTSVLFDANGAKDFVSYSQTCDLPYLSQRCYVGANGPFCCPGGPWSNNSHFEQDSPGDHTMPAVAMRQPRDTAIESGVFNSQSLANTINGESSVLFDSNATKDLDCISFQTRDLPQRSLNLQNFFQDSTGDHTLPADAIQQPRAAAIRSCDFNSQSLANTTHGESSVLFDTNATQDLDSLQTRDLPQMSHSFSESTSLHIQTRDLPQMSQNFLSESTSLHIQTRDLPQMSQYLFQDSPGDHIMPAGAMQRPHTAADKSGDFNSQSLANTIHGDTSVLFDSNATKDFDSTCLSNIQTCAQPQESQNVVSESTADQQSDDFNSQGLANTACGDTPVLFDANGVKTCDLPLVGGSDSESDAGLLEFGANLPEGMSDDIAQVNAALYVPGTHDSVSDDQVLAAAGYLTNEELMSLPPQPVLRSELALCAVRELSIEDSLCQAKEEQTQRAVLVALQTFDELHDDEGISLTIASFIAHYPAAWTKFQSTKPRQLWWSKYA